MSESGGGAAGGRRRSGRHEIATARRLVVKVGSSSICGANAGQIDVLVDALAGVRARDVEVVLVSSGAIATGLPFLRGEAPVSDLATKQAAAAVGQSLLVRRYQESLDRHGLIGGQVLLTAGDLDDPTSKANAQRAMDRLLSLGILPIVNENDTVATEEIRFGDNDRLAALVARLVQADALVLLSDVDALYTRPPTEPGAKRIDRVGYGDGLDGVRVGAVGKAGVGTGGAVTKVAAARHAAAAGIGVLLASALQVHEALRGEKIGTWFEPAPRREAAA